MNFLNKIKALHLLKQKWFIILLAAQCLLLMLGIMNLFGKNNVYQLGTDSISNDFGKYDEINGGYFTDGSDGQSGNMVSFENITLPKGIYSITLLYTTDTNMVNMCTVADDSVSYKALFTNGEHLYAGLHQTDFYTWLLQDTSQLKVNVYYGGEGRLSVTGLMIRETNGLARIGIFGVIILSVLINIIYIYFQYDKKHIIPVKDKNIVFGLLLIMLFASFPLFTDYLLNSGDLTYHLMRIEGIKDGILSGQFPVRIAPEWQQGNGYASSIFYGETLLYPAALFRILGFTVLTSCRLFLVVINIATVLVSYYCFKAVFQEKYIGLLCSMLYSLSIYRIYKTYCSGSLGETFAILFLPLLVYGFYRVFTEDIKSVSYKKSWVPLTIGFAGLIQSHLLSCELAGLFTILLCIVCRKKVFRRETFLALAKTVIYSALLSAWFLVPFMDYMLTGDFIIMHVSARTIQERGLYLAHLLFTFPIRGVNVFFTDNGMADSDPMGIGFALFLVLVIWGYLLFFQRTGKLDKKYLRLGQISGFFALLAMCMSLSAFPWDKIQFLNSVTATLVSSIQFPNRFLTIATVLLTALAGVVARTFRGRKEVVKSGLFFGGMLVLTVFSSIYLLNDTLYTTGFTRIYNGEGMGTGYIAGSEYLPYGTDASLLTYRAPSADETVIIEGYDKGALMADVNVSNLSTVETAVEVPLLYYKGYRAWDTITGEFFTVYPGNNNAVSVTIPPSYSGILRVAFQSPWYWRLAEVISVLTFMVLSAGGIWFRKVTLGVRKK